MHLAKGNEPTPPFVPENHPHALQALEQRKSPYGSKLGDPVALVAIGNREYGCRDDGRGAPDIGGEPTQDVLQVIMEAAVQRRLVKIAALVMGPEGVLELVLDVEQPHTKGTCEQRDRQLQARMDLVPTIADE